MINDELSLGGLFLSSFLAATLLPGGSEAVLFGVLKLNPGLLWPALALATLGNTLGGMSSYLLGRILPERKPTKWLTFVHRYGSPALLLAWAPLIGDALCVAAGCSLCRTVHGCRQTGALPCHRLDSDIDEPGLPIGMLIHVGAPPPARMRMQIAARAPLPQRCFGSNG